MCGSAEGPTPEQLARAPLRPFYQFCAMLFAEAMIDSRRNAERFYADVTRLANHPVGLPWRRAPCPNRL